MKKNYMKPSLLSENFVAENIMTENKERLISTNVALYFDGVIADTITFDDGQTLDAISFNSFKKAN